MKQIQKNFRNVMAVVAIVLFAYATAIAQPTHNPYKYRYGNRPGGHWTDSLPWGNIVDVTRAGGVVSVFEKAITLDSSVTYLKVDSTRLHEVMDSICGSATGGVLYFPSGTPYLFESSVNLCSGLIIRGDKASDNHDDAVNNTFAPPTIWEFPYYQPFSQGNGTPISTAFKKITRYGKAQNIALIDLDINRAGIIIHPEYEESPYDLNPDQQSSAKSLWPVSAYKNRNVLIMGIRSNNVATPDDAVPATGQKAWQRYSWRFECNIDVMVAENVVIANNRINDVDGEWIGQDFEQWTYDGQRANVTRPIESDNFGMGGYAVSNWPDLTGNQARFHYTHHYGIGLNRFKRSVPGATFTGPWIIGSTPVNEPAAFATGVEFKDNWVMNSMRTAVQFSGLGAKVTDNVIRDIKGKVWFLDPTGKSLNTNMQVTFENRGFDATGWFNKILRNKIEVYRHGLGNPSGQGVVGRSADGEGVVLQRGGAGTTFKGYDISENEMLTMLDVNAFGGNVNSSDRAPIDIGKRGDDVGVGVGALQDMRISNNKMNGNDIYVIANFKDGASQVNGNLRINYNTDCGEIKINGSKGGGIGYATYNTAQPAQDTLNGSSRAFIVRPCYISLNPDPNQSDISTNGYFRLDVNGCVDFLKPLAVAKHKTIKNDTALNHSTVPATQQTMAVEFEISNSGTETILPLNKVQFYNGTQVVDTLTASELAAITSLPATVSFDFNVPMHNSENHLGLSVTSKDTLTNWSDTKVVYTCYGSNCADPTSVSEKVDLNSTVSVFPNPTTGFVNLVVDNEMLGNLTVELFDMSGRNINRQIVGKTATTASYELNLSSQKPGMYFVRVSNKDKVAIKMVVKQ